MNTRKWFILGITVLLITTSLGCAIVRIARKGDVQPTPLPLPTAVSQQPTATSVPTATPTMPPTGTPVPTDTPTHTPMPTDTPVPAATNTPVPTDTPVPQPTAVPPTDTPPPPPTDTPVSFMSAHGVVGSLTLLDTAEAYPNRQPVRVHWSIKNESGADIKFGILGITMNSGTGPAQFQSVRSSLYELLPAGGEISTDDVIRPFRFGEQVEGDVEVVLSMCFEKSPDECEQPGADWENVSPSIFVHVIP